jgi:hypothetical protein
VDRGVGSATTSSSRWVRQCVATVGAGDDRAVEVGCNTALAGGLRRAAGGLRESVPCDIRVDVLTLSNPPPTRDSAALVSFPSLPEGVRCALVGTLGCDLEVTVVVDEIGAMDILSLSRDN